MKDLAQYSRLLGRLSNLGPLVYETGVLTSELALPEVGAAAPHWSVKLSSARCSSNYST